MKDSKHHSLFIKPYWFFVTINTTLFRFFSPKQQFHFFVKRGVAIRLFVLCFTVAVAASLSATEISYIFLLSCTSSSALFALYIL